jgi:hypothetical protein
MRCSLGTLALSFSLLGVVSCGLDERGLQSAATDAGGTAGAGGATAIGGGGSAGAGEDASTDAANTAGASGSGGQASDAAADAPADRVTDGLVLLYEFKVSAKEAIDTSGYGAPYDLTISDPDNVAWGPDHLELQSEVRIQNTAPATKLVSECMKHGELTVEAWVEPANSTQGGPARVFSHSQDAWYRNFSLMQFSDAWGVRIRTTQTTLNGTEIKTGALVTTSLAHLVFTRAASGAAVVYVDSAPEASMTITGDFSNWDTTYGALAANEFVDSRKWLGKLHLIAVYCRALSAAEVVQNHLAGP